MKIKESDKLRVKWNNKEQDLVVNWPLMFQGSCDGGYLFSHVFTKEVCNELIKRGYDLTTLKFSIAPKLDNPTRPERFKYLINKYNF